MSNSGAAPSPVVPGKYFVFVERLVREQYQVLVLDADSEQAAHDKALELFFAGSLAYMSCAQVEPVTARVRPVREKNLRKAGAAQAQTASDAGLRTSARFHGDPSEKLQPGSAYPGTQPSAVARAQARLICQNFDATGHSNHSGRGTTLWVVLEHCAEADIAYNLRAMPGVGYYVERAKAMDDGLALRMSVETAHGSITD